VELDPVILWLGRQFHPEGPYQSSKVTAHVDDAGAFLKKTDLIVFAFLDSTALLSEFSSLRLDNCVYTVATSSECIHVLGFGGGAPSKLRLDGAFFSSGTARESPK
jgi:hypothetical protein